MTGLATVTSYPDSASGSVPRGLAEDHRAPLLEACRSERLLLDASPRIWVALSGGADSTALLHAVVAAGFASPIGVTHIDHGVQSAAKQWAEHCLQLCQQLGVTLRVHRVTPPVDGRYPGGFEAWARAERYQHWRQLLGPGEVLLCAHHADDQAETIALRLLQGRLPLPMPRRRVLGAGVLLRPLLGLRGVQLRQALEAHGQCWVEDPSNQDAGLLRNRVRGMLPVFETRGPWFAALRRCGVLVERKQRALEVVLGQDRQDSLAGAGGLWPASAGAGELARLGLAAIPGAVALQGVLALFGSGPVSRRQAHDALIRLREQDKAGEATGSARGGVRVGSKPPDFEIFSEGEQAGELRLFVAEGELVIWREPVFAAIALGGSDRERVVLPHGTLEVEFGGHSQTDSASLSGEPGRPRNCVVRPLAPADRLLHNGRLLRVKELLRASGVPRWARSSYPVVADRDQILAVPAGKQAVSGTFAAAGMGQKGWLRDGSAPGRPTKVSWIEKLPS